MRGDFKRDSTLPEQRDPEYERDPSLPGVGRGDLLLTLNMDGIATLRNVGGWQRNEDLSCISTKS